MRALRPPILAWVVGLAACGADVDSGGPCDDAPVVTWESFGQGFLTENCQACHAEGSEVPMVPDSVSFGTEADVDRHRERILARATGDAPTMPPQGGVDEADRERLRIWLTCW